MAGRGNNGGGLRAAPNLAAGELRFWFDQITFTLAKY
jgi:hypothetical protein